MSQSRKILALCMLWTVSLAGAFFYGLNLQWGHAEELKIAPRGDSPFALSNRERVLIEQLRQNPETLDLIKFQTETGFYALVREIDGNTAVTAMSHDQALTKIQTIIADEDLPIEEAWALLSQINPEDIPSLLQALARRPSLNRADRMAQASFVRGAIIRWARTDPIAATNYARTLQTNQRRIAIAAALGEWAKEDPIAAFNWVGENFDSEQGASRSALYGVFQGMAKYDSQTALRHLDNLPSGRSRISAYMAILDVEMVNSGPSISTFRSMLETDLTAAETRQILQRMFRSDAFDDVETANAFVNQLEDPEHVRAANLTYANRLVRSDPQAAAEWAIRLGESAGKEQAIRAVTDNWARRDLEATAQWLNEQDQMPELDPAFAVFARQASKEDPESAITWAAAISDASVRQNTVFAIARQWNEFDPEAADRFISESKDLTEQQRATLLRGSLD